MLLHQLNLYYFWSQSIVKSWRPMQIFRFITLLSFCELSRYWPLCRYLSSVSQAKEESLQQRTYMLLGTFFWNTGWNFWVLTVIDEPLTKSNTERRVKISAGITKEGAYLTIYLLSIHKIWCADVLIKLMNQNFSKSKNLHDSSKFEYFQLGGGGGGGGGNFGFTNLGGKHFEPLKSLGFQQLSYL